MKETNSCFLRIASKSPFKIKQNLYTAFKSIIQVGMFQLEIIPLPQKRITQLPFLRALEGWKSTSLLTCLLSGDDSPN